MNQQISISCPRCGTLSSGAYCPNCGQSLKPSPKITMKVFWKDAAKSFTRLTPGFWNTFIGLLLHPWEVIRQYINGERSRYSAPITMMMQLLLYSTFFYTILGNIFHIDFFASSGDEFVIEGHWFLTMLINSDVLSKIMIACVPAFNCYLVYGLTTGRKYNLAEYLTAAIYMGCSSSIYFNLLKPLQIFYPETERFIIISIVTIIGTIALSKAFPIRRWWQRCLTWLAFVIMNVLTFLVLVMVAVVVKMMIDKL